MPCFCVFSDKSPPVELTLYSPNNQMCLKKMRFSCLVLLHCGLFGCPCIGDKEWSSVIFIWSGAQVLPSVPRRCPWSDGGLVTGCLQGRCDRNVVIRGDGLHGWTLKQMNIDRQLRSKLKLCPNLFIVLSKVENDLGDVSGPLSLELFTHVQHRSTRLKRSYSWIQQLHIFSFECKDCLANTCHADLSELGWCLDSAASSPPRPGFPSWNQWASTFKNELIKAGTSFLCHNEATCETLFDGMHPNKGDWSAKHLAMSKQTNKSD